MKAIASRAAGTLGNPDNTRGELLEKAGFDKDAQVRLTAKTIARVEQLLDATETKFFQFEGQVTDQRTVVSNEGRLKAIDASYRLLGIAAPRQEQKVTVVHKLELPAWSLPDGTPGQVIDIEGKVE